MSLYINGVIVVVVVVAVGGVMFLLVLFPSYCVPCSACHRIVH